MGSTANLGIKESPIEISNGPRGKYGIKESSIELSNGPRVKSGRGISDRAIEQVTWHIWSGKVVTEVRDDAIGNK